MKKVYLALTIAITLIACNNQVKDEKKEVNTNEESKAVTEKSVDLFVNSIEKAHQKDSYLSKDAVSFDIAIQFGGKERLNGKMTLNTDSSQGLIELNDGSKIFVNEDVVMASPKLAENKGVRFDAYAWSYFFQFPYKLGDEGTQWSNAQNRMWNDTEYETKKLSFNAGIGDAPDDWYVVYKDKNNHQLTAASYIVTLGKTKEKAEEDPHAISYSNYKIVENVPMAAEWKFWGWNDKNGFGDKQIGAAQLSNFKFVETDSAFFEAPENFVEIK